LRFLQDYSLWMSFLSTFTASQVNKMQLGEHYLIWRLNSWSAFNVKCEYSVSTWRCFV
jgi:hypothetical protein